MIGRIISTAVAVLVYGWVMMAYNPVATLVTSEAAGKQFENSDQSYLQSVWTMGFFSHLSALLSLLLLVVLILIWFKPVRDAIKNASTSLVVLVAAGALLLGSAHNSYAFFATTDRTEIIPILPNQSAFSIPGWGANKDTQAQFDSEAYLNTPMDPNNPSKGGKIAAKFYQIPHAKLTGSAGYSWSAGWDYFVNTATVILVDRTRFSREWVDATDRGTSSKKEGFPCQSKGDENNPTGLNITVGIAIGAYVTEANAAKFLYNFGVKTPANINYTSGNIEQDGKAIFQSVYNGRSLVEVMDDVGRKQVGTLICGEIAKRTFDDANNHMTEIMDTVREAATKYFVSVGISLDFIGYHDTWQFDKEVQDSLNRRYAAIQDQKIAQMLQPYADVIKILADAQAVRSFGDKTDGKLPTTFVGPAPAVASPLLTMPSALKAPAVK
jgi:hypothetical protein